MSRTYSRTGQMRGLTNQLCRDFTKACVLLVVAESPRHGYEILDRLEEFGLGDADPGGLYRLLRALEEDGFVRSVWDVSNHGPPRRVYRISRKGRSWLDRWTESLPEALRALNRYRSRYSAIRG